MFDTTAKGRYNGPRGEGKDAPQGRARDRQEGEREVQVRPGQGGQAARPPRDVLEHPAVKKDIRKLDPKVAAKAVDIMHGLASGKEYPTTHALNGNLKGWYATNVTSQHRITHQFDGDDLLVGHVGPHNYDVAAQRLASEEHVPDLVGKPDSDHLETVLGKPETHNRPHSREEVARNAAGRQDLFHVHQYAQGEHARTDTLCQAHAYARAVNHAGAAGLNKETGDGRLEGSHVEPAGKGSCPTCTSQQRGMEPSVRPQIDEYTKRPQRSLSNPNPRPEIGPTAPFHPLPHSLNAFTPNKRVFTHTDGMDHRLWKGEKLRPEVRDHVLNELDAFWKPLYGEDWRQWARVYFAGSEASEWTSSTLEGNNDFDTLVGVSYHLMRDHVPHVEGLSDEQITDQLNAQFKTLNNPAEYIEVDGVQTGPWDHTWYVNPSSYDIRAIKPYAAYELVADKWWVKPAHLPHWSLKDFPEAVVAELRAVEKYVKAVLNLPEPLRTQQGAALFTHLHSDRSRAFSDRGEGWYDPANLIEKWLDQEGLWPELVSAKHRWDAGEGASPKGWDNNHPFGIAAAKIAPLKVQAAAAIRKLSMPMTDMRDKDESGKVLPDSEVERYRHKSPEHAWESQVDHEQHYGDDARKAFAPHNIHVNDDDDAHPIWHMPPTEVGHGSPFKVREIPGSMHLHTDQDVIHMPTVEHYREHGHLDRRQTEGTHPILGKDSHPDNHPQVVKFEGKHWLMDGHHRTLGSRMRGDSHLKVWYRDADAEGVTRETQTPFKRADGTH